MNYKWAVLVPALFVFSESPLAESPAIPVHDKNACMEGPMAQFGRYIGNWNIEDSQLGQDGQTRTKGDGARWNFLCLGNGTAINSQPGFAHIQAQQDDSGNIVMHYKSPLPDPLRRITFFPPDEHGWNWKLEFSSGGGETWFEVYRIRATPGDEQGQ